MNLGARWAKSHLAVHDTLIKGTSLSWPFDPYRPAAVRRRPPAQRWSLSAPHCTDTSTINELAWCHNYIIGNLEWPFYLPWACVWLGVSPAQEWLQSHQISVSAQKVEYVTTPYQMILVSMLMLHTLPLHCTSSPQTEVVPMTMYSLRPLAVSWLRSCITFILTTRSKRDMLNLLIHYHIYCGMGGWEWINLALGMGSQAVGE
jgi:hypothetical protein